MRILAIQETDWIDRNPILHHRMLESLSIDGADVTVIDFDIHWRKKGIRPFWHRRQVRRDCHKFFPDAAITLIRPAMVRLPVLARLSWLVGNWLELKRIHQDAKPDVIVAYGISNAYLATLFARRHRVRFVYHLLDALHTLAEPALLRPIARFVEQRVMRAADAIVVVNRHLKEYAVGLGAPPSHIEVIPMGTTIATEPTDEGDRVRRKLGLGEADFVLTFVGWLYRFSGLKEVALELERQAEHLPNVKLLVVGDGPLLPELQKLAKAVDLGARLIVTGKRPQDEIAGYIAASDVCLLPAERNGIMEHIVPAKVIEYMQQGKPVVATRLPGIEAEFGSLPGLILVDAPARALDPIYTILASPEGGRARASAIGKTCLTAAANRDDWATVTDRFEHVLQAQA